jgi:hypothetical protein
VKQCRPPAISGFVQNGWNLPASTFLMKDTYGYSAVITGLGQGTKKKQKKLFEMAKDVGSKRRDERAVKMAEEKLRNLR